MFTITIIDSLSIQQIADLAKAGESVMRSAHTGNQYSSNMALMAAGIPTVFYDRTTGRKDCNYHPHLVLRQGQHLLHSTLCHEDVLVAKTTAGIDHLDVLRRVFPRTPFEQYGDYLRRQENALFPVLPVLQRLSHTLRGRSYSWRRFVTESGQIEERTPLSWSQIESQGVYGVTAETHGWLMPNIFNVLLFSLYESLEYQTNRIHHLSGPDMIKYVGQMEEDLSRMWSEVSTFVGAPAELDFRLYPTASARFVTTMSKRNQLDELIRAYERFESARIGKGDKIRACRPEEKTELIQQLTTELNTLFSQLEERVRFCGELFVDVKSRQHLTHHDAELYGLYVPHWTLTQPLSRLADVYKTIAKAHFRLVRAA